MTGSEKEKLATPPLSVEVSGGDDFRAEKRKQGRVFCGITVAILVLAVLIVVILAVTVFKAKNPTVTVNSVSLEGVAFDVDPSQMRVRLNATIRLDLSVKNPNVASFKFGNTTTAVYYRGTTVGEALLPPGKIKARRTADMTASVTILGDRLLSDSHLLSDVLSGSLAFTTSTTVAGRIDVLNVFKHHAKAYVFCSLTVSVAGRRLETQTCTQTVKL